MAESSALLAGFRGSRVAAGGDALPVLNRPGSRASSRGWRTSWAGRKERSGWLCCASCSAWTCITAARPARRLPAQDYATRFPNAAALLNEMFPGSSEGGGSPPAPGPNDTSPDAGRTGPYLEAVNSGNGEASAKEADPSGLGSSSGAPPVSRFQVLRFHAAGALGEVFVAQDGELHREVALKEIKRGVLAMRRVGRGSSWRRRSPATSSTRGSCRSTEWVHPDGGLIMPCASSGAKPWRRRLRAYPKTPAALQVIQAQAKWRKAL